MDGPEIHICKSFETARAKISPRGKKGSRSFSYDSICGQPERDMHKEEKKTSTACGDLLPAGPINVLFWEGRKRENASRNGTSEAKNSSHFSLMHAWMGWFVSPFFFFFPAAGFHTHPDGSG